MRLIELTRQYEALLFRLENDEEFDMEAELEASAEALESKLDSCAWMYRNLLAESEAFAEEAKRLKARSDSLEKAAKRLKSYIAFCLREQPLKTKSFSFSFRPSEAVEIVSEAALPEAYLRVMTEPAIDIIRQDLKNGATVPGAILAKKKNLQIK